MSLTLIFPVSAEPSNTIEGNLTINSFSYGTISHPLDIVVPYGTTFFIDFTWLSLDAPVYDRVFNGTVNFTTNDYFKIFLAVNPNNSDYHVDTSFDDYRSINDDFTDEDRPSDGITVTYDEDTDDFRYSSITSSFVKLETIYMCYDKVPAGTYSADWIYFHTESNATSSQFIIGVYGVPTTAPGEDPDYTKDPVGGFENGYYDFSQALDQLISNMESVVNGASTTEYKNFYVNYTSAQIEILEHLSDIKYNSTVSDFNDNAETIVNNYESSDEVDPTPYIDELSALFTDVLTQATTAEQGSFISSVFQNVLAKLQLAFDVAYKEELDGTISDEQLETDKGKLDWIDSWFTQEEDLRDKFSQAEFTALSDWRTWMDELGDYTVYREIFNFLFDDAGKVSAFVVLPFSILIVSILLGTATTISRSRRDE